MMIETYWNSVDLPPLQSRVGQVATHLILTILAIWVKPKLQTPDLWVPASQGWNWVYRTSTPDVLQFASICTSSFHCNILIHIVPYCNTRIQAIHCIHSVSISLLSLCSNRKSPGKSSFCLWTARGGIDDAAPESREILPILGGSSLVGFKHVQTNSNALFPKKTCISLRVLKHASGKHFKHFDIFWLWRFAFLMSWFLKWRAQSHQPYARHSPSSLSTRYHKMSQLYSPCACLQMFFPWAQRKLKRSFVWRNENTRACLMLHAECRLIGNDAFKMNISV